MAREQRRRQALRVLNRNAAGIDIGSNEHWVAVPPDRDPEPVRRFAAFTADLVALADWLRQCGVTSVVMEATGVYWIPLFQILETRGFEVKLVNATGAGDSMVAGFLASTTRGFDYETSLIYAGVPSDARMHYVITSGASAPNVVPDFASARQRAQAVMAVA